METAYAWLDGEISEGAEAMVPVLTHALHYGTAIIEGVRFYETRNGSAVFRLEDHLKRLYNSARIFQMPISHSPSDMREATLQLIRRSGIKTGYIRILAFYGSKHMGINPRGIPVSCLIAVWPWTDYWHSLDTDRTAGIRACFSSFIKHHANSTSRQAKISGNYANSVFGRLEAVQNGYDEGVFLDENGYVCEASVENIFLVEGESIRTPHESLSLKGITRDTVIRLLTDIGITTQESFLTRDDLYIADEVWLTGTATEITPVASIDGRVVGDGTVGEMTGQVIRLYREVVTGKNSQHREWLTMV